MSQRLDKLKCGLGFTIGLVWYVFMFISIITCTILFNIISEIISFIFYLKRRYL